MAMAGVLYPPPSSLFVSAMTAAAFLALSNAAFSEFRGQQLNFSSKNDAAGTRTGKSMQVPSRVGKFYLYAPPFLAAAVSLAILAGGGGSLRIILLAFVVSVHFLKRILEVLFVHKYSGGIDIGSLAKISLSYFFFSVTSIYSQYLAEGAPEPGIDLKYAGVVLFFVGILGNFYHHYLLSKLRSKDGEGYKIPRGGLFCLVICPHYLFEVVDFIGITFVSQTFYTFSFTLGTSLFLMGKGYASRNWYLTKFPNFPEHVKAVIPYVF